MRIYHICGGDAWKDAQSSGAYRPESVEREGFIHCSFYDQVLDSAMRQSAAGCIAVMTRARAGAR
jgi:uncharacterized protein (DUF952 family)